MKLIGKQLVIVFLSGAAVGWVGGQLYAPLLHRTHWAEHWGKSGHPRKVMLERFRSKLDLTPEQQQRVAAILVEKRNKIDTLRGEMRPKFEEIRNATQGEIRQILTSEQQKKFDAMIAERQARAKHFRDRWGGKAGQEEKESQ